MGKIFCGRLVEKKDWMIASILLNADETLLLDKMANANNGFIRLDICNNKNGDKTYCCIDTFNKEIPRGISEAVDKPQYNSPNQKANKKPYKETKQVSSNPPAMPDNTDEEVPF